MSKQWNEAQKWEAGWWGNCINSLAEEMKELMYVPRMGLKFILDKRKGTPYLIDMKGASVLDVGGGPISILLKCVNVKGKVIDPIKFPDWVYERYKCAGIEFEIIKGEDIKEKGFDEVWLYNVLQHVENPEKVVQNCRKAGKIIRIYEWIDIPPCMGHLHMLTEEKLNNWLKGEGKVEMLKGQGGCIGKCYYGVFKGFSYEEK